MYSDFKQNKGVIGMGKGKAMMFSFVCLAVFILSIIAISPAYAGWQYVSCPYFKGLGDITIAIDSNDNPYIAYFDRDSYKVSVIKFDGTSWVQVGSSFSGDVIQSIHLAIDGNNTPYLAYRDGTDYKANVMKFDGTSWVHVGSPDFSGGEVGNLRLAIDNNNVPYVSYADWTRGYPPKASVMKYNGVSWIYVGSAGFSASEAYPSLAFDSNNTPYVELMVVPTLKPAL